MKKAKILTISLFSLATVLGISLVFGINEGRADTPENVLPKVDACFDKTVNEGEVVNFEGYFGDPGLNDTHTATWDFGDGNTASGTVTEPVAPPANFINNGDFENDLINWECKHYTGGARTGLGRCEQVYDPGMNSKVLEYKRSLSYSDGGAAGVYQPLNIPVSGYDSLRLEADVKVISNTLTNSGWWSKVYGGIGEFPAHIMIYYKDRDGNNQVWTHGFLPSDNNEYYGRTNFSYVTRNQWYHYLSPNLLTEITTKTKPGNQPIQTPPMKVITGIFVGGNGWDFKGRYDNVKLYATGAQGRVTGNHTYGDNGVYTVTLTVTDNNGGVGSDTLQVTVNNVPPIVSATGDSINEGETATISATFSDPGWLDTHAAEIDWGDGIKESVPVTEENLEPDATGSLTASHTYGDNGIYTITIRVIDDNGGIGEATTRVEVANLAPDLTLDISEAISYPGGKAFTGRKGAEQEHQTSAIDPGSDDLIFNWNFGVSHIYYNNGQGLDPYPSPGGIFPFTVKDIATAIFNFPGLYTLSVGVADDDGGVDSGEFPKIVTDDYICTRSQGFWKHQFGKGKPQINSETLKAYLDIVNFASAVFSEIVPANTLEEAVIVFQGEDNNNNDNDKSEIREKAQAQLLAAWLNYAGGAVAWTELIEIKDEKVYKPFSQIIQEVEAILLNPEATHQELEYAKDLAEAINKADECKEICEEIEEIEEEE